MTRSQPSESHIRGIARLLHLAGTLKQLPRQGWVDRGVHAPESVADHSYRLALFAFLVAYDDPDIDVHRAIQLAIIHDLPEALAGDVTPFDEQLEQSDVDRDTLFRQLPELSDEAERSKTAAERDALYSLITDLPPSLASTIATLWEEYEAGTTPEARLVRQLDKLETWLQALEYRQDDPSLIIESFRLGLDRDLTDDELTALRVVIDEMFDSTHDENV